VTAPQHPRRRGPWWRPADKAWRGAIAFLSHLAIASLIIGGMWWLSTLLRRASVGPLRGVIDWDYLFQTIDVGAVGLIGWYGLKDIREILEED
jgi:hypothetical protein